MMICLVKVNIKKRRIQMPFDESEEQAQSAMRN